MDSSPSLPATETISAQLRLILRGMLAVLGIWRLEFPQMRLVQRRFSETFQGLELLLERFRAGRLRRVQNRETGQRQRGRTPPSVTLPRRFGWLVKAGGHQAACFGTQLQTVLQTPEMATLLAASPQAVRMLRPLCRALAVELPWTRDTPRKVRPRKPRPKPEPFRPPLPRGVLARARRDKAFDAAIERRNATVLQMAQGRKC